MLEYKLESVEKQRCWSIYAEITNQIETRMDSISTEFIIQV